MSRTPGGRDLCRWPAPGPKPDVIPGVQQVHTPTYRPDAAFYNQGYVGRGLGGHLCLPAIAATTAQGGQHSSAKIANKAPRIARCRSRNSFRLSWPTSPGPNRNSANLTNWIDELKQDLFVRRGCRTLAVFKGAGFRSRCSIRFIDRFR